MKGNVSDDEKCKVKKRIKEIIDNKKEVKGL